MKPWRGSTMRGRRGEDNSDGQRYLQQVRCSFLGNTNEVVSDDEN